jgi:hypothetical protein
MEISNPYPETWLHPIISNASMLTLSMQDQNAEL